MNMIKWNSDVVGGGHLLGFGVQREGDSTSRVEDRVGLGVLS